MQVIGKDETEKLRTAVCHGGYLAIGFARAVRECLAEGISMEGASFEETDTDTVLNRVEDGVCGVGVIRWDLSRQSEPDAMLEGRGLRGETLWQTERILVTAAEGPVTEERLAGMTELALKSAAAEDRCGRERIVLTDRGSLLTLLRQLPESFAWSAPLPARELAQMGLRMVSVPGHVSRIRDILVVRRGRKLSRAERILIDSFSAARNQAVFSDEEDEQAQ